MNYFAGMFDADGYVSLVSSGHFIIGMEKTNEKIIDLFISEFSGHKYERKRDRSKKTFTWTITTNKQKTIEFIDKISPYTKIKTNQLLQLKNYLNQSRIDKRGNRSHYIHTISELKKPIPHTREQVKIPTTIKPEQSFFEWFAGFIDGDGNFTIFEYQNGPIRTFDSWIGAFNTHAEPIIYIKERIQGSISQYKGNKFPIWKWVASQAASEFVCESLQPHLIIKKEQCRLVSEYLKIHKNKVRGVQYDDQTTAVIRDIVKQIKYHNSL